MSWKAFGNNLPKNFQVDFVVLSFIKILKVHNRLIIKSFEKALQQEQEEGNKNPSKSRLATILSDFIEEHQNFQFGERRLRDYYNDALAGTEVEIKQNAVLKGLSGYLGYDSYTDFVLEFKEKKITLDENENEKRNKSLEGFSIRKFLKNNKISFSIAVISVVVILLVMGSKQQRWMKWDGNNYMEISFDADKLKKGELKVYKEDRITSFKLLQPNCDTQFFNADGSVRVWYAKNKNGTLDFFSDYGLHPISGKTLKPITRYIIEKYVCE